MVNGYLRFWKQREKIGSSYNDWANVARGIPQKFILEPLIFDNFINDIFLFIEKSDICKCADDNALFSCGDNYNLSVILKSLEKTHRESGKVSIYDSSEIPTVKILSYNRVN